MPGFPRLLLNSTELCSYVGSFDETLYAVDAATGEEEWAFTQPSDVVGSSPTVADGTVHALFTGRPPFEGAVFEVVDDIKTEMPTPPSEVVDLPTGLDDSLLTALAAERTDRYERVPYMGDDLQELFDSYR